MRIGAHMSAAGGVSKAVDRAALHECEALQIFARNPSQWRSKPIDGSEAARFRQRVAESGLAPVVAHASYLINLAAAPSPLREQSIDALLDELARADDLGLLGVVVHPGTCTSGTEGDALGLVAEAILTILRRQPAGRAMLLLENTAGQGRTLGYTFEHLATILERANGPARVGVCLDTCHLLAAGYDIVSARGYDETLAAFERTIGTDRLRVFHGNDSKKTLGSRVDRHEHIGQGCLGLAPFWRLLRDPRFRDIPMLIETAKAPGSERPNAVVRDPFDTRNLDTLRALRASPDEPPAAPAV